MNIKNPCRELKIQNSHWNMSLRSPIASTPKIQVVPNNTEHANAMRTEANFSCLAFFFSRLCAIPRRTNTNTMRFCMSINITGPATAMKNGIPRTMQLNINKELRFPTNGTAVTNSRWKLGGFSRKWTTVYST